MEAREPLDWIADGNLGSKYRLMKDKLRDLGMLWIIIRKIKILSPIKLSPICINRKIVKLLEGSKKKTDGNLLMNEIDGKENNEEIVEVFHGKFSAVTRKRVNSLLDVVNEFCSMLILRICYPLTVLCKLYKSLSAGVGYDGIDGIHSIALLLLLIPWRGNVRQFKLLNPQLWYPYTYSVKYCIIKYWTIEFSKIKQDWSYFLFINWITLNEILRFKSIKLRLDWKGNKLLKMEQKISNFTIVNLRVNVKQKV